MFDMVSKGLKSLHIFIKRFTLKIQSCKLKKNLQMTAYVFQKYLEDITFQLVITLH